MNLRKLIKDYLKEAKLMQVATSVGNHPWVCSVWYVHDENFNLYFISRKDRRHSKEIKNNSDVAGTIVIPHEEGIGQKVRGIQFEGKAEMIGIGGLYKAYQLLKEKYPNAVKHIPTLDLIKKGSILVRLYKIIPKSIVLFDEINFPDNPRQEYTL